IGLRIDHAEKFIFQPRSVRKRRSRPDRRNPVAVTYKCASLLDNDIAGLKAADNLQKTGVLDTDLDIYLLDHIVLHLADKGSVPTSRDCRLGQCKGSLFLNDDLGTAIHSSPDAALFVDVNLDETEAADGINGR